MTQGFKPSLRNTESYLGHERLEESRIVPAEQHGPEILTRLEKVVIIGA